MKKNVFPFVLVLVLTAACVLRAAVFSVSERQASFESLGSAFEQGDFQKAKTEAVGFLQRSGAYRPTGHAGLWFKKIFKQNISEQEAKVQYLLGQAHFELKAYSEAEIWFGSVARAYPESALGESAQHRQAECLFQMGRVQDAARVFEKLLARGSGFLDSDIHYSLSLCYQALGKTDEAVRHLTLTERPDVKASLTPAPVLQGLAAIAAQKEGAEKIAASASELGIASLFYEMGQYGLAAEHAQKLAAQKENPADSLYRIGLSRFQLKEYARALEAFQALAQIHAGSVQAEKARFLAAECRWRLNDLDGALADYAALASSPSLGPQAVYKRALILTMRGDYEKSIAELSALPKPSAQARLLEAYAVQKKGDQAGAIQRYRKILDSSDVEPVVNEALYLLASAYLEQGDYAGLVTHYQNVLRTARGGSKTAQANQPGALWRPKAYLALGEAYYKLGKYEDAALVYQAVMETYPSSDVAAYALSGLAASQSRLERYGQAAASTERLGKRYGAKVPEAQIVAELEAAHLLYNQKKYRDALGAYERFLDQHPQSTRVPQALFQKGQTLARLEYYSRAVQVWESLADRAPGHELAWQALDQAALTAFGLGEYDHAVVLNQRLAASPDAALAKEAFFRVAQSHYNGRHYRQAITAYEAYLAKYPKDERENEVMEGIQLSYFQLASAGEGAEAVLNEFAQRFGESRLAGEAYWRMGASAYEKKDYAKATDYFKRVVSDYPQTASAKPALYYLAESQYQSGRMDEAVTTYKNFVTSFPSDDLAPVARFHLANALYKSDQWEQSVAEYQALNDTFPQSEFVPNALLNQALAYQKLNRLRESSLAYKVFLKRFPERPEKNFAVVQIASLSQEDSDYAQALTYYQLAAPSEDISRTELQFRQAECFQKMGKQDMAIESYSKLLSMRPQDDAFRFNGLIQLASLYEERGETEQLLRVYRELASSTKDKEFKAAVDQKIDQLTRGVR